MVENTDFDFKELNSFVKSSINNKKESNWDRFVEKFKISMFGVIHILLKEDHEPYWLCSTLAVYDSLQKLTFPFNHIVN